MRLHRLELTAFLAFAGHEVVDFDALSDAGLFLLQGPTGAGKSSILDAICFALYGTVADDRPGAEELRSHHAAPDVKTEVTLEVTLQGRRLRIVRSPEQERAKLRGEGTTKDRHKVLVSEILDDGTERPLSSGAQEAGDELRELLGMKREQFRQVVMLPQGGFAQVLHADSAKREELLRGLFDVQRFSGAERWLKDQAAAARKDREAAEAAITATLALATHTAGTAIPEGADAAAWLTGTAGDAAAFVEAATAARDAAVTAATHAREAHAQAREQAELIDAASMARAAADAALVQAGATPETTSAALREAAAQLRERAGATRALIAAEDALVAVRERAAEHTREHTAQTLAAEAAALAHASGVASRPDRELALQQARTAQAQLAELDAGFERARERAAAAGERDGLRLALDQLEPLHVELQTAALEAKRQHLDLRERHLNGYAARLAEQLTDGEPCVVCGATEHPRPHPAPEGGDVSEADVQAAQAEEEQAAAAAARAGDELQQLRTSWSAAIAIAGDAPCEQLTQAIDVAREALTLAKLQAGQVEALEQELASLDASLAENKRTQQEAAAAAAAAGAAAAAERERAAELEHQLTEARGDAESITARAEALTTQADAAEAAADALDRAQEAAERIADMAAPAPLAELARADAAAAEAAAQCERTLALAAERATTLEDLTVRYAEAVTAAEPLIARHELVRDLHEFADGTAPGNTKRMRLTVFVLAARLEAVAAAATQRLEQMSRGRYAIVHSDEHRGRKARGGLDLRIFDSHTGCERAPCSLSGGETFYASLALALGLADVITAESGGTQLETLFIDEGFGTLDDEGTLDDVLDVLDGLRAGGRAVGVVSHVRELRDRITTQLRVERGINGSHIVQAETYELPAGAAPAPIPTLKEELDRALPVETADPAEPAEPAALF